MAHCAHRRPNFTSDRSEARGHGAAHAALPPVCLGAGCACWCAPDGFAARKRRGGTQGAATPEGARRGGPPPAWSSLMGLLRPQRAVAPAPRAPTDARGDHARPPPRILQAFTAVPLLQSCTKQFAFCALTKARKPARNQRENCPKSSTPDSGSIPVWNDPEQMCLVSEVQHEKRVSSKLSSTKLYHGSRSRY